MTEQVAQRIMIVGGSGSGKTWLTHHLATLGGLPAHHVDGMKWRPRFRRRRLTRVSAMTRKVHAKPFWILEGAHYETAAERVDRADALIWMEVSRPVRVLRVIWRAIRYSGKVRPAMSPGCTERLGPHTIRVVRHAWVSPDIHRPFVEEMIATAPPHLRVIHLRSGWQARRFLRACRPAPDGPGVILPA